MHLIRTAEAMACALDTSHLKHLLQCHVERLAEYEDFTLEELAEFLIVEAGDTLIEVEAAYGERLVAAGIFTFTVETITLQGGWYEAIWIKSDDGYGLVLMVQDHPGTDAQLLAACQQALGNVGGTDQ